MLFLGIIPWNSVPRFNEGEGGCISDWEGSFLSGAGGGVPHEGASVLIRGVFEKNGRMAGGAPPPYPPHYGKPCTLSLCENMK